MNDAPTIEYVAGAAGSPSVTASRAPLADGVAFVLGGGTVQTTETQELLRSRLRAVAWLYLIGQLGFLARSLMLPEPVVGIVIAQIVVILSLIATLLLLRSRAVRGALALRGLELTIFLIQAFFLAYSSFQLITRAGERDDMLKMTAIGKDTMLMFIMMIVTYGLFIPNTWRRAALVIAALSVPQVISRVLSRVVSPSTLLHSMHLLTFELVSENLQFLLMGAIIAIYGAHVIHRLRVEAFQARQLGQYRLGERLGSGGMGEVYLAEHQLLKRPCAIKLIAPERAADPRAMARFEREVRVTARLSHPNTIEIYDYGKTDDGTFYYAMEYLRGYNLDELVKQFGPQPPGRIVYLLRQACSALGEAHGVGLVHRDIKPANIFASVKGGVPDFVKLLDFGLVKPLFEGEPVEVSQEGIVAGSPLFMAPEQASGPDDPDHRADVYALGAVGYYLLTGRPPFAGQSVIQVVIAHARDLVEPPSKLNPAVPEDLERVVLRCLEKSPAARYASVGELDDALAACDCAREWSAAEARRWWEQVRVEKPAADSFATKPTPERASRS